MKKFDFKKLLKNRNFVVAICVFVLTIVTIGVSYASFFTVKTNKNNQAITTGTLQVSFGNETSAAVLRNNMNAISNEEGMMQSEAKIIHIQNTGNLDSTFVLNIGYDMQNFTSRSGYSESDLLTPLDYVNFAVYEYNGVGKEDTLIVGPLSIAELPIYSISESDARYNRYSILFNTVGSTTSGKATKTYKIKMWLSDKAIPAASFSYFYINTEVVAEVENAKMKYNISGKITDGTNPISGAIISFHNNSLRAQTDASGIYNLNGVYPGTYNIDIIYNNKIYSGNLTIEEGSSKGLVNLGPTFTGTNIYSVANNYKTTLSKILKKNNLNTYSSAATINGGNLYPTYKLTGGADANLTNLEIALSTDDFTMSLK